MNEFVSALLSETQQRIRKKLNKFYENANLEGKKVKRCEKGKFFENVLISWKFNLKKKSNFAKKIGNFQVKKSFLVNFWVDYKRRIMPDETTKPFLALTPTPNSKPEPNQPSTKLEKSATVFKNHKNLLIYCLTFVLLLFCIVVSIIMVSYKYFFLLFFAVLFHFC